MYAETYRGEVRIGAETAQKHTESQPQSTTATKPFFSQLAV
jgi:hypothetical protein